MFKSCCSGSKKKKNKNKLENMENSADKTDSCVADVKSSEDSNNDIRDIVPEFVDSDSIGQKTDGAPEDLQTKASTEDDEQNDSFYTFAPKPEFAKKRFSVDFKTNRLQFKRYSVDSRTESESLEQLQQLEKLEQELAKTNIEVRPGKRRQSSGILKSTASSNELDHRMYNTNESVSDEDEVFESSDGTGNAVDGSHDTPATPVGRDELALRRHRFFSDLVSAARAAVEHRVRFDPLGPVIADSELEAETLAAVTGPAAQLESLLDRLERVTSRLESLQVLRASSPAPSSDIRTDSTDSTVTQSANEFEPTDNMSVNGYQDLVQGPLQTYLSLSKQIGGDVAAHANLVNAAFQAQLRYIQLATTRSKPAQAEEQKLLAPTSDQITAIQQFREKNRVSPFFNHLSAISESIPALGWVAVAPTPAPYVKEMNDAGQFYTNRVLKDWKEKDKRHVEWCKAWVQVLTDLQAFVKQHHTTGLVWSGKGGAPPPPPGGMPPPPPALPEADFANMSVDDRSALFAQINQGENITSNLRKVKPEMQTHKNPNLRQGPAPFKAANSSGPTKALPTPGAGAFPDKAPVFARDGKKWLIEYQKGNSALVVDNAEMNNVVYMYRCRESSLTVRGKINGIVMDSCSKCAVVFDNLVASIEFVNCQSVQMQVLGKVPTISIDKTDGCQMYLSPESLAVEVVSSKSSEMNVLLPKGNGDYTEHPIPEQFKTVLNKGSLSTTPVESTG